jgi:hypothetical protein
VTRCQVKRQLFMRCKDAKNDAPRDEEKETLELTLKKQTFYLRGWALLSLFRCFESVDALLE